MRTEVDIDVPLRLKQGQVEVEPQGIVDGSLEHAVLVATQLVQVSHAGALQCSQLAALC